jgi:hypothetical protein
MLMRRRRGGPRALLLKLDGSGSRFSGVRRSAWGREQSGETSETEASNEGAAVGRRTMRRDRIGLTGRGGYETIAVVLAVTFLPV